MLQPITVSQDGENQVDSSVIQPNTQFQILHDQFSLDQLQHIQAALQEQGILQLQGDTLQAQGGSEDTMVSDPDGVGGGGTVSPKTIYVTTYILSSINQFDQAGVSNKIFKFRNKLKIAN